MTPMRLVLGALAAALILLAATPWPGGPSARATFSGARGKIAFERNTGGGLDIFIANADGSGARALTADHASFNPDWQAGPPAQGDVDCDGDLDSVDGLKVLRHAAGLDVTQEPGCPQLGSGAPPFGDVDCSGAVDAVDALLILRSVAGLPVTQPPGCGPIGPGGTPGATPSPAPGSPTPSPTPEPAHLTIRNSGWHLDTMGNFVGAGEVVNESGRPIGLVRVEAYLYSASGELLKKAAGYSCLMTIPAGGDSPFEIVASAPPSGLDHVTMTVTQFFDPPFIAAPEGLQAQVSNQYTDAIGYLHAAGSVSNGSNKSYKLVKACLAFYDAQGAVFRSRFSFASPNVLAPGASGNFDSSINPAGTAITDVRVWPDGMEQ